MPVAYQIGLELTPGSDKDLYNGRRIPPDGLFQTHPFNARFVTNICCVVELSLDNLVKVKTACSIQYAQRPKLKYSTAGSVPIRLNANFLRLSKVHQDSLHDVQKNC